MSKLWWLTRLAVAKMREGPGPWLRAVRRGLFDALPPGWKANLARRRFRIPEHRRLRVAAAGTVLERAGETAVVLPVFNHAALLGESIASVLAQQDAAFELILLDDGSTDGIDAVLQQFAGDARLRILRQPNRGLPAALSNAFRFAAGEFRTWTSADNLMEPPQLARLGAFLRQHPASAMVYADYTVIDASGQPLRGSDFRPQNRRSPESSEVRLPRSTATLNVLQDNFIGACFLYRGWVGRLIGGYSSKMGVEDYDYWMRVNAEFGIEHLGTDELLYRYRWHDNSLNARAKELALFEIGAGLMAHERTRAAWRAEPWTVLERGEPPMPDASGLHLRAPGSNGTAPAEVVPKTLLCTAAATLEPEGLARLPDQVVISLDWDAARVHAYRWGRRLRDPRLVHFTGEPEVAEVLALFTDKVFEVADAEQRRAIAEAFGNELVCARRTGSVDSVPLPNVWTAPGRRRRVLLQVDDFVQGGLESVVLDQARLLRARGFDVSLLALGSLGTMADRARAAGLEPRVLDVKTAAAYRAELDASRAELVLAHHSLFGGEVARERGVPFVQTLHNTYHWLYPDDIDAWRRADAATSAYVHVSANVARFAHERLGLSRGNSLVVDNGVALPPPGPLRDVAALRRTFGLELDDYVLLHVASIYPPKAQYWVAQALAAARAREPRLKVVLLGRSMNDRYETELQQLISTLGLQGALLPVGFHADTEPFYALADALLLPSYWEGCSLAIAEALVRGLPCVATDVGAARDQLRDGEGLVIEPPAPVGELDFGNLSGYLARPRDGFVDDLAAAMLQAAQTLRRLPDDPRRQARFDVEGVGERYARILAWLIDGGRPAPARVFAWAEWRDGELW